MIKHKVNITTSANVKRVLKTLLQNCMSKAKTNDYRVAAETSSAQADDWETYA